MNVAPGEWTAEMWGWDGGDHVLLGETPVSTFDDGVTIIDLHVGISDGVLYPEECLSSCE